MTRNLKLLTPTAIGPISVKNRIVLAAVHTNFAERGDIGPRAKAFYERRAGGGAGLIMVGVANSQPPRLEGTACDFSTDAALPSFQSLVAVIHANDARAGIQLTPLPFYGHPSLRPAPEQLPDLIENLARAADRARRAGFDLVELMVSGGSLFSHMLSPVHNTWKIPGYSDGPEERMRFALEAVSSLRKHAGPGVAVTVRIHGHEFLPGGYGCEQACRHACRFQEAGADGINVTGGGHTTTVPQITMEVPRGAYLHLARAVRRAVRVPVFASNRIHDPDLGEKLLRRGDADLVNLPRSLVADPDLPLKAARGEFALIRPCIACATCFDCAVAGEPMICAVNPEVSHEHEPKPARLPNQPRALVIGGGPAGCEAAARLSERGARVTLLEVQARLGGKLNVASVPPGREEIAGLVRYYERALPAGRVEVHLGESATPEQVAVLRPEILVLACGNHRRQPEIDGLAEGRVVYAEQVLRQEVDVGQRVVVIGAGGAGVEVALFVAASGTIDPATQAFLVRTGAASPDEAAALAKTGKQVTLCCRGLRIGFGIGRSTRWTMLKHLETLGVRILRGASYLRIGGRGLTVRHPDGSEEELEADTVIVAAGFDPDPLLNRRYQGAAARTLLIGDAGEGGNIRTAIRDAWEKVRLL